MIFTERFGLAGFRPIMHEGGAALLKRQNRLFPLPDKETPVIAGAYSPASCERLIETNANYFFLLFHQGFSGDREKAEREEFSKLAEYLHEQGVSAMAGIAAGHRPHYAGKPAQDTFALRPNRKLIPSWIPGYSMTCWCSAGFVDDTARAVEAAMECGADGVWFEPVIFGAAPAAFGQYLIGPAGCACRKCESEFMKYSESRGLPKPASFPPVYDREPVLFAAYAEWRSGVVAEVLRKLDGAAKDKNKDAITAALLVHPAHLDSATLFGADARKISASVDVILAESNNFVNFEPAGLTYDSTGLEILMEYTQGQAIAAIPRPAGPRFDTPAPPQLHRAAMWEAVSCGAAPAVRSAMFFDEDSFTAKTLAHGDFREHRDGAALLWNWIDRNAELFENLKPRAQTAVLHSPAAMSAGRENGAARFFKILQTLTELHIQTKIVAEHIPGKLENGDFRLLIIPSWEWLGETARDAIIKFASHGGLLFIGGAPEWAPDGNRASLPGEIFAEQLPGKILSPARRALLNRRHSGTPAVYFQHRFPSPGPVARLLRNPGQYRIPSEWKQIYDKVKALLADGLDIEIEGPPYILVREYRRGGKSYFHVVNLLPGFPGPAHVILRFPAPVQARILTPDKNKIIYTQDRSITVEAKSYAVAEITGRA